MSPEMAQWFLGLPVHSFWFAVVFSYFVTAGVYMPWYLYMLWRYRKEEENRNAE